MKKTIYLLRHGHTPLTGTYIGSTNCPLSESGIMQVKRLKNSEELNSVTRVIASPLLRCKQTVEILDMAVSTTYEASLQEIDFGRWETKTFAEILKSDPELCSSWLKNPADFTFPDGESIEVFKKRVEQAFNAITTLEDEKVLVVAHGGMIRYLICRFLGLNYKKFNSFKLEVASYAEIEYYQDFAMLAAINKSS